VQEQFPADPAPPGSGVVARDAHFTILHGQTS
jgi:hypothetical protein